MSFSFILRYVTILCSALIGFFPIVGCAAILPASSSEPQAAQTVSLPMDDIQRFAAVVSLIHRYYITPVEDKTLFNYAISGMLSNLDPHSDYLDEEAMKELETTTTGKFGGIGIEIIPSEGALRIISPIDSTPADRVGLKAGDLIIRIDHKLVRDMTLREAVNMIRGESGTKVHLTILRKKEKKPLEFNVFREIIKIQTIRTELLSDYYGYIRLSFFQDSTYNDLIKGIKRLLKQATPLKGIILDLRNNPGGLLDSAVDVSDVFLESSHLKYGGLIVYTQGRMPDFDIKAVAHGRDIVKGIPMVVLINEGSASAAEIVAGALQDQERAIIVGERSFGKGSVQTVLAVNENAAVKLTTALYYTPSGRSIQAKGIEPDIDAPQMNFPKGTEEPSGEDLIFISEADLEKHLPNTHPDLSQKEAIHTAAQQKERDLVYTDFQLYQALNILKGMRAGRGISEHTH